eukprot:scaffold119345_cov72-Phaeocystis_antarctica.AAC.9
MVGIFGHELERLPSLATERRVWPRTPLRHNDAVDQWQAQTLPTERFWTVPRHRTYSSKLQFLVQPNGACRLAAAAAANAAAAAAAAAASAAWAAAAVVDVDVEDASATTASAAAASATSPASAAAAASDAAASATAATASDAAAPAGGGVLSRVGSSHFRLRECTVAPGVAAVRLLSEPCCKRCGDIKTGKGSRSCSTLSLLARDAVDSTSWERRGEGAAASASAQDFCGVRGARPGVRNLSVWPCRRML